MVNRTFHRPPSNKRATKDVSESCSKKAKTRSSAASVDTCVLVCGVTHIDVFNRTQLSTTVRQVE